MCPACHGALFPTLPACCPLLSLSAFEVRVTRVGHCNWFIPGHCSHPCPLECHNPTDRPTNLAMSSRPSPCHVRCGPRFILPPGSSAPMCVARWQAKSSSSLPLSGCNQCRTRAPVQPVPPPRRSTPRIPCGGSGRRTSVRSPASTFRARRCWRGSTTRPPLRASLPVRHDATSTSLSTISEGRPSSAPPHTRRVMRSTECPRSLDACVCACNPML